MNPLRSERASDRAARSAARRDGIIQVKTVAPIAPSHEFAILDPDTRPGGLVARVDVCRPARERHRDATEPPLSPKDPMP